MCFPSDRGDDCAFLRSCSALVGSRPDLASPRSEHDSAVKTLESLPPGGPLFIMSQKKQPRSRTPVPVARPGRESGSSCSRAPLIPLVNEHVQSTHCVSLKPDYINQGLNFKGQVPLSGNMGGKHEAVKSKGPHTARSVQHSYTSHHTSAGGTTQCNAGPRPHS